MPTIKKPVENPRLFTDDDPFMLHIPKLGDVRLSDYSVNPPLEDDVSPETKPVTSLVEFIVGALHPDTSDDDVEKVRDTLNAGLADNSLTVAWVGECIGDVTDVYSKAFEEAVSKESGRPTRRRRR